MKVIPTPNNGSSELIPLHRTDQQEPWFIFQKTKYYWDSEIKSFRGLQFPINHSVKHYCEWKGYLDQAEVEAAEEKYGKNKYVARKSLISICFLRDITCITESITFALD